MTRDDDPIRGAIKAAVSLVMSRVAEKDTVWSAVQAYARLWQRGSGSMHNQRSEGGRM